MQAARSGAAENRRIGDGRSISAASLIRPPGLLCFVAPCWSKRTLAVEDGAQFRRVNVTTRDYTDNISPARQPCKRRRKGGCAGRLGDNVMTACQQADCIGNLRERHACRL